MTNDISTHDLNKSACVEVNANGCFSDLDLFFKWLHIFVNQQKQRFTNRDCTILLLNSFLYKVLFQNVKKDLLSRFVSYCENENIYILFYPTENTNDIFNRNIYERFKEMWEQVWEFYSNKHDPNSQVTLYNNK